MILIPGNGTFRHFLHYYRLYPRKYTWRLRLPLPHGTNDRTALANRATDESRTLTHKLTIKIIKKKLCN